MKVAIIHVSAGVSAWNCHGQIGMEKIPELPSMFIYHKASGYACNCPSGFTGVSQLCQFGALHLCYNQKVPPGGQLL